MPTPSSITGFHKWLICMIDCMNDCQSSASTLQGPEVYLRVSAVGTMWIDFTLNLEIATGFIS